MTRLDKIRNEYLRGNLGVTNIAEKMRENSLGWSGHVERRNNDDIIKTSEIIVEGK